MIIYICSGQQKIKTVVDTVCALEDCHENPFKHFVKKKLFLPGFSRNDESTLLPSFGRCGYVGFAVIVRHEAISLSIFFRH